MPTVYVRTLKDLKSVVTLNVTQESLFVDFKVELDRTKDDWQVEAAQDVAQFANTLGGCLLVGVAERKDAATNLKIATAFKGVDDPERTKEWVEQAITQKLVPGTLPHDIAMVTVDGRTVVAVNVPPSRRIVYVWHRTRDDETIRCVYRTNHGKARMNPDEMERHMMNASRAARLAFTEAKVSASSGLADVHGGVWAYGPSQVNPRILQTSFRGTVTAVEESWFQFKGKVDGQSIGGWGGECVVNIPFDLLRSVWVDHEANLALLLSVRLVLANSELILEPL
jgi:hypothetical protein